MSVIRYSRKPLRKLLWIGVPIANTSEPARVHMEHLETEVRCIANHGARDFIIDFHSASPTVIHKEVVFRILPSLLVAQHLADSVSQHVSGSVGATLRCSEKNPRSIKSLSLFQASSKRARIRIQSDGSFQRLSVVLQAQLRPPTKLDAHIPAVFRAAGLFNQKPGNNFARLIFLWVPVCARCPSPLVARSYRVQMCANFGRRIRALFHV